MAGNKYVFLLGGEPKRLRLLSKLVEERARFAYREPSVFAEAREALHRHRAIILRGAPGRGKTAMAVRLLLGVSDGAIYHLDSKSDIASLADLLEGGSGERVGIEPGAGFLLDQPRDPAALDSEVFGKVQGALEEAGSWLVLTVPGTGVADSDLLTGVVDVHEAPASEDIVRSHMNWRLGEHASQRLLDDAEVKDLLGELASGSVSCKQAADFAESLCDEHETGEPDLDRVRERWARLEVEDFEIWAEGLRDPVLRSTAIALAVLNGLPQENVARASRSLRQRLTGDQRSLWRGRTGVRSPSPTRSHCHVANNSPGFGRRRIRSRMASPAKYCGTRTPPSPEESSAMPGPSTRYRKSSSPGWVNWPSIRRKRCGSSPRRAWASSQASPSDISATASSRAGPTARSSSPGAVAYALATASREPGLVTGSQRWRRVGMRTAPSLSPRRRRHGCTGSVPTPPTRSNGSAD